MAVTSSTGTIAARGRRVRELIDSPTTLGTQRGRWVWRGVGRICAMRPRPNHRACQLMARETAVNRGGAPRRRKGQTLMPAQGVAEDNVPTRHAVRVDWFRRDPGGGTIFVVPARGDGAASQWAAEDNDAGGATHDD